MIKKSSVALALLLTVACASNPIGSSGGDGGATAASTLPSVRNAPDYVLLSAPNQVRSYDFGNSLGVRGLHVRGVMTNRGFMPIGEVQGNGKFCSGGTDWLSLSSFTIHKAEENKTPAAPYILGCAAGSGFQPASRAIVAQ
jgi:hypothetical protein